MNLLPSTQKLSKSKQEQTFPDSALKSSKRRLKIKPADQYLLPNNST